jgi:sugar phosphate isomerase/epimerase
MSLHDFQGLSLNTATVRKRWSLPESIEGCLRTGYTGISPSRKDIQNLGISLAARMLRNSGLAVTGLNPSQLQPLDGSISIRAIVDDLKAAIDQAKQIDARCLVVVSGGSGGGVSIRTLRSRFREVLDEISPTARAADVKLGIEPLNPTFASDRSVICDLTSARQLAAELGNDFGIIVDLYHTWWDPRFDEEIALAGGDLLLGYHVNDWLGTSSDRLNDRGMIGDGVIDIRGASEHLALAGYRGFVEIEIMSTRWWDEEPDLVLRVARDRIDRILSERPERGIG